MKKTAAAVMFLTVFLQTTLVLSAAQSFSDVPESHWAAGDIGRMAGIGVIDGVTLDGFDPGRQVTRAEYVKLLIELGLKTGSLHVINYVKQPDAPYEDVANSAWYYSYVVDAYNRGMLEGGRTFRPDQPLSREDMAFITANFYRLIPSVPGGQTASDPEPFADMNDISPDRKDAVLFLVAAKLVGGTWNTRGELIFAPKNRLTRAEAAVMTARLYDQIQTGGNPAANDKVVLEENGITFTLTRQENQLNIEADMGERKTGGYMIRILGARSEQDIVSIEYEAVFPKPGDTVTQAFTHPKDMLVVQLAPNAPMRYKLVRIQK